MGVYQNDFQKLSYGPTVISHIVLAVSSVWSILDLCWDFGFTVIVLSLYAATGVLGIAIYSSGCGGNATYKLYCNLWVWSLSLGLPSISLQLFTGINYSSYFVVFVHYFPPCLFVVCNVFYKRTLYSILEVLQGVYLLAIAYVSFVNLNYYGFSLVVSYTISFYVIGSTGTVLNTPAKDLLSISLAFSNYFMVRMFKGN